MVQPAQNVNVRDQRTSITYPFQIGCGIHFSRVDRHDLVFPSSNYLPGKRSSLFHRHASSFSAIPAHKIILHRPTRRLSGSVTFVKTFVGINMRYRCHDESSESLMVALTEDSSWVATSCAWSRVMLPSTSTCSAPTMKGPALRRRRSLIPLTWACDLITDSIFLESSGSWNSSKSTRVDSLMVT